MKIAISAESTIDLPQSLLEEYDIHTVPFGIVMGEETFLDGEVKAEDLFSYADKNNKLPKTNAVNQYQYEEHFKKLKELGYDGIIHFSLSNKISSACQNAIEVSKHLENVVVIDTLSLSTGIALQAIYASKLAKAGYQLDEIVSLCQKRIPYCQASFSLESVNYLYLGGRCSMLKMLGANVLHLKPAIIVENGSMKAGRKYRGNMMKAVMGYVKDTLSDFSNYDLDEVFITFSSCEDDVLQAVKDELSAHGFKNIHATHAGATISTHCGPHCLGILYFNDGEHGIEKKENN